MEGGGCQACCRDLRTLKSGGGSDVRERHEKFIREKKATARERPFDSRPITGREIGEEPVKSHSTTARRQGGEGQRQNVCALSESEEGPARRKETPVMARRKKHDQQGEKHKDLQENKTGGEVRNPTAKRTTLHGSGQKKKMQTELTAVLGQGWTIASLHRKRKSRR